MQEKEKFSLADIRKATKNIEKQELSGENKKVNPLLDLTSKENVPPPTSEGTPRVKTNPLVATPSKPSENREVFPYDGPVNAPKTTNYANQFAERIREPEKFGIEAIKKAANSSGPTVEQSEPVDKPFWEDVVDGFKAGYRQMVSAGAEGASEIADLVGSYYTGKPMGYYNLVQQAKAKGNREFGSGAGLRKEADIQGKKAEEINRQADTESFGYFAGSMAPYMIGTATAVGTAPVSGTASAIIGGTSLGATALSSFGSGIQEYDKYKREIGQEIDPNARLGIGLLYGGAEFAMEKLALDKFMPKQFRGKLGKLVFGALPDDVLEKTSKELVEEFAQSSNSRARMVKDLSRGVGEGAITEGATEAATEVAQEFTNWLYQEKEDRAGWQEILSNVAKAAAGGALMGSAMGPLSYGSQRMVNDQRRKQANRVVLAQNTKTGETLEIVGQLQVSDAAKKALNNPQGETQQGITYEAIRPNGKVVQVSENEVGDVVDLPYDTFKNLLNGKIDGQAAVEQQTNAEIVQEAQTQQQELAEQYEPFVLTDPLGNRSIAQGKFQGKDVFVTGIDPNNPNAFVITDMDGNKKMVDKTKVSDINQTPYEEFISQNVPVRENDVAPFDPSNPVQVGEEINFEGENWVVTGVDKENGMVQLESMDEEAAFEQIPLDIFQQIRKPNEENLQEQEQQPESSGAGQLRELFSEQNQEHVNPEVEESTDNIESKKAEIEKRRQEELEKEFGNSLEAVKKSADEEGFLLGETYNGINAKYDTELAALEKNEPNSDSQEQDGQDSDGTEQSTATDAPQESADQGVDREVQRTPLPSSPEVEGIDSDPKTNNKTITNPSNEVQQTQQNEQPEQEDHQNGDQQVPEANINEKAPGNEGDIQKEAVTSGKKVGFTVFGGRETGVRNSDGTITGDNGTVYRPGMVENVQTIEEEGQKPSGTDKPKKGQAVFNPKNNKKGVVTKVHKPKKGSALEGEPYLLDVTYEDGKKAINMPGNMFSQIKSPDGTGADGANGKQAVKPTSEKPSIPSKSEIKKMTTQELWDKNKELDEYVESLGENEDITDLALSATNILQEVARREKKNTIAKPPKKNPTTNIKTIRQLAEENKKTAPKIPSEKVFQNTVQNPSLEQQNELDKLLGSGDTSGLPIKTVPVSSIVPTQKNLTVGNLENTQEVTDSNEDIILLKVGDKYYVLDGHHRIANEILKGKENVTVRVSEYEQSIPKKNTPKTDKIKDVGEVIHGAAKHKYQQHIENLRNNTDERLANKSLTETIPEPDYSQLVDEGTISVDDAITLKLMREDLGRKPKSNRIRQWVEKAKKYSQALEKALEGKGVESTGTKATNPISEAIYGKMDNYLKEQWENRVNVFKKLGWPQSGITPGNYDAKRFIGHSKFSVTKGNYILKEFNTQDEAIEFIRKAREAEMNQNKGKSIKFDIYRDRKNNDIFIGKKVGRDVIHVKDGFTDAMEARKYRDENQAELEEAFARIKEIPEMRRATNQARIGEDYRNGEAVTAEKFMETFGFRGVQFGNWVVSDERQDKVNEAYDALMDLANVLNIPPKAIGLNGTLGMAFGARGRKGTAAHYEPGQIVINLTRKNGAGSLAHEWWHALDNYFSRSRNKNDEFLTEKPYVLRNRDGSMDTSIREEVVNAFDGLKSTIAKIDLPKRSKELDKVKSKPYYSTRVEMTARAFESYVIDRLAAQKGSNDFLANIYQESAYRRPEVYPYPKQSEKQAINEAYDHIFQAIKVDETKPDRPLYSIINDPIAPATETKVREGENVSRQPVNYIRDFRKTPKKQESNPEQKRIQKVVDRMDSNWTNGPKIQVMADPEAILSEFPNIEFRDLSMVPAFYTDGKMIINASHPFLSKDKNVETVVLHEVIGHHGLQQFILKSAGKKKSDIQQEYENLMDEVFAANWNHDMMRSLSYTYFGRPVEELNKHEMREVAEEYIAHNVQAGVKESLMDRVVAKIREILRKIGFAMRMTDAELRNIIGNSYRMVMGDDGMTVRPGIAPAASTPKYSIVPQTQSQSFKEWFGDWELMGKNVDLVKVAKDTHFKSIKEAKDFARKHLQGKTFTNRDTGEQITVGRNGIDKTLSNVAVRQSININDHLSTIPYLGELLKNSVLAETHNHRSDSGKSEVVQRFYGAVEINGEKYRVKTTVKKSKNKESGSHYTYEIQEMELMPRRSASGHGSLNPDSDKNPISLAKLLKGSVKNNGEAFDTEYSKVVDENGQPLVVYHGTNKNQQGDSFTFFNTEASNYGLMGMGAYFTENPDVASKYTKKGIGETPSLYPVYLSIKNPIDMDAKASPEQWRKQFDGIDDFHEGGDTNESWYRAAEEMLADDPHLPKYEGAEIMQEGLRNMGYDGITHIGGGIVSKDGVKHRVYIAFEPTQIKSATGNNGQFSNTNPDIRYMVQDNVAIQTERLQKAHKNASDRWTNIIEKYQDNMVRAKNLIKEKLGTDVKDSSDFYTKENLSKGKTLVQTEAFMKDFYDPLIKTGKTMNKKHGVTMEEIGDYLYALHAPERNAYIKEQNPRIKFDPSGMSDEEANTIVETFENKVPEPLRKQLVDQVQAINKFVNDKRLESGLISEKVYQELQNQYENYVPLRGWEDLQNEDMTVYSPMMSAKGRKSKAGNPIPYLVTAAQEAIMKGENNKVRQSVLEFVKENPSHGDYQIRNAYYRKTGEQDESGNDIWEETTVRPPKEEFANGNAIRSFNPDIHKAVKMNGKGDNVLPAMVNGKKVFIEFKDERISMAIKNTSQEKVPRLITKLRAYTRWLSSMYTQYSPEFGFRNLIRDMGFASFNITADDGLKTLAKTGKNMGGSMKTLMQHFWTGEYPNGKDGKMLKEFMDAGALTGYSDLKQAKDIFEDAQTAINRLNQSGWWSNTKNLSKSTLETALKPIDVYNRAFENATRFSYYKALREQGVPEQQAAIKAKDLTVNFNRKGNSSSLIGSIYMFFNASVQGTERLIRSFTNPKTRKSAFGMMGALTALGMAQSIMYGMMDDEDEDGIAFYDKVPEYVKRTHIIIPNVFSQKDGEYLKIPLPYGINVFYSMGESIGRVITGRNMPGKAAIGLLTSASDSFSPIGGFDFEGDDLNVFQKITQFATPSALQPVTDLAFNRNFAGFPIYKEPFTPNAYKFPNSQSYFPSVNPAIRSLTDVLNSATGGDEVTPGVIDVNPEWIEYGMEQYFGGPVQFGKNVSGTIAALVQGENVLKDPNYRKLPFVRNYLQKSGTQYQTQQQYYDNTTAAKMANATMENYLDMGNKSKAEQYYKEHKALMDMYQKSKEFDKVVRGINKNIKLLAESTKPEDKKKLDELYDKRAEIMKEYNKMYHQQVNKPKQINSLSDIFN